MNTYDCIIVGSGVAGLSAALALAGHGRILLLTKGALEESATQKAQGGIAAALGADDSAAAHLADTLAAGAGLVDASNAGVLTADAPARIADLVALGVAFDRAAGAIALGREAAHGTARIVHAGGDATGFHLEHGLAAAIRDAGVEVREHAFVTRLLTEHGHVAGVDVLPAKGAAAERLYAPAVILATGGAGQLYRFTTNPSLATGDGVALAYCAGAEIMDMEFIQFHPTALRLEGAPAFLISEAVRGEGAILRDESGRAFMSAFDPRAELAPRDVVARAIHAQMAETNVDNVFLDLTHLEPAYARARFPQIDRVCRSYELDFTRDPLPVAPAAHYTMGGVRTGAWGETNVAGLYACGEAACTGVHGANRLASNSLLEGLVFGRRTAARILDGGAPAARSAAARPLPVPVTAEAGPPTRDALQRLMWSHAGILRDGNGLDYAATALSAWQGCLPASRTLADYELANLVLDGRLVAEAAILRRESRGAHYRTDFPQPTPAGIAHFIFRKDADHAG